MVELIPKLTVTLGGNTDGIFLIPPGLFSADLDIYLIIVFSVFFANLCFTACYFDGELTLYYTVT